MGSLTDADAQASARYSHLAGVQESGELDLKNFDDNFRREMARLAAATKKEAE